MKSGANVARYKIKKKKDGKTVIWKRLPEDYMTLNDIYLLEDKDITGLYFPAEIKRRTILYQIPRAVTLEEYLKREITVYQFYAVIVQVLEMVKNAEVCGVPHENIVYQPDLVFVKEMTEEVCFLYLKELTPGKNGDPFQLIRQLRGMVATTDRRALKEFNAFLTYIEGNAHLTVQIIESYILENYPQIYQQIERMDVRKMRQADLGYIRDEKTNDQKRDASTWKLVNVDSKQKILVDKARYCIGKSTDNDLVLDGGAVSRHHAILYRQDTELFIEDLGSTNHSYINGQLLAGHVKSKLDGGDQLQIANIAFEVIKE